MNMTLIIRWADDRKNIWMRYSIKLRHRKYIERYGFLLFGKTFGNKYWKKIMDAATKTGINAAKATSKKVVQKPAEATGNLERTKPMKLLQQANQKRISQSHNKRMRWMKCKKSTYHKKSVKES